MLVPLLVLQRAGSTTVRGAQAHHHLPTAHHCVWYRHAFIRAGLASTSSPTAVHLVTTSTILRQTAAVHHASRRAARAVRNLPWCTRNTMEAVLRGLCIRMAVVTDPSVVYPETLTLHWNT